MVPSTGCKALPAINPGHRPCEQKPPRWRAQRHPVHSPPRDRSRAAHHSSQPRGTPGCSRRPLRSSHRSNPIARARSPTLRRSRRRRVLRICRRQRQAPMKRVSADRDDVAPELIIETPSERETRSAEPNGVLRSGSNELRSTTPAEFCRYRKVVSTDRPFTAPCGAPAGLVEPSGHLTADQAALSADHCVVGKAKQFGHWNLLIEPGVATVPEGRLVSVIGPGPSARLDET